MTTPKCPNCVEDLTKLHHHVDYSTTRGPMTAYDVWSCSTCGQLSLQRTAAQTNPAKAKHSLGGLAA